MAYKLIIIIMVLVMEISLIKKETAYLVIQYEYACGCFQVFHTKGDAQVMEA